MTHMQAQIRQLLDRQEISDCVQRYCRGVDRFDQALLRSAFHDDFLDEHGKFVGNADEFVAWALEQHARAQVSHQHLVLNQSAEIDGDTAHVETYFMFVAMNRAGHAPKPVTMGGGRYIDRMERRGGEWRISARVTLRDWGLIDDFVDPADLSAFTSTRALLSDVERAFMNAGRGPVRGPQDPSYERPLRVDPARRAAYLAMRTGVVEQGDGT